MVSDCSKPLDSAMLEIVFPTELILFVNGLRLDGEINHVKNI